MGSIIGPEGIRHDVDERSLLRNSYADSNHVIFHERLRLVEDLQVLGRDENVLAVDQGQLQGALAGELDIQAGAVEEGQIESDQAAERDQPADPRRPGGTAVALAGDLEVVRPDVDRRRLAVLAG